MARGFRTPFCHFCQEARMHDLLTLSFGHFWTRFGHVLDTFSTDFRQISITFGVRIMGRFMTPFWVTFWTSFWTTFLTHFGHILDTFWTTFGPTFRHFSDRKLCSHNSWPVLKCNFSHWVVITQHRPFPRISFII